MKYYIFCCFFCLGFNFYGQEKAIIERTVLTPDAEPVPNSVVNLLNSQFEALTDSSGDFKLEGIPSDKNSTGSGAGKFW